MEKPPHFEMKISTNDVAIFNNFTDSQADTTETSDFANDVKSFALHHLVKECRTEEIYNCFISLSSENRNALIKQANTLDFDGMAALHYTVIRPSTLAARILLDNNLEIDVQSKFGETPLHLAIRHGQLALANLFMDRGADTSKTDNSGNNALHLSIERGLKVIALKILTKCPDLVSSQNITGNTPLHFAAALGDVSLCEKVLLCERKVTTTNINGETPLHTASLVPNNLNTLKILVERGCLHDEERLKCLGIRRNDSLTALHVATIMGHVKTVRFILDMGFKVDADHERRVTALALAASTGNIEIMELLLQNGAKVGAKDQYGNTPLHLAARKGQVKAMQILIENNAEIDATNEENWTPLFYAVSKHQYEAAELLLRNGAVCSRVDSKLCSCLHYAVREDSCKLTSLLLKYGGECLLFQRNSENRLVFQEAVIAGNERILELLLMKSAATIVYFEDNKTLVHVAAEHGQLYCLQKLINMWPRDYINMVDSKNRTALHLAAMNGHRYAVQLLIKANADMSCVDKDGRKAHHLAALNHHNDVLKVFIDAKVEMFPDDCEPAISSDNVEAMNMIMDYLADSYIGSTDFKYHGFNEIFAGDHEEIAEAVVEHHSFSFGVRCNVISLDEIMPTIIKQYPEVALKILDKGISFSRHRPDSPDFQVDYDFAALETSPDFSLQLVGNELYFGPALMARLDRMDCLKHPLTQKMMTIKWNLHGAFVYYTTLLLYLAFTILLTTFIILHREFKLKHLAKTQAANTSQSNCTNCNSAQSQSVTLPSHLTNLAICIFAFTCLQIFKEIWQLVVTRQYYFMDISNVFEWAVIVSVIVYLNGGALFRNYANENTELLSSVLCLILSWLDVMLFLRRSPLFNIYVVMFTQVILTLARVLLLFTPLLLAFGLVFYQLFLKQTQFRDTGNSLMKAFVMLTGELEYSDTIPKSLGQTSSQVPLVPLPALSYMVFVFFIIGMPIALMNLLVGLAVGDIESIRKTAKYNVLKQQALYIESLHSKCPKFFIKMAYRRYYTEYPNKSSVWNWLTSAIHDSELYEVLQELRIVQQYKGKKEKSEDEKVNEIQESLEEESMLMSSFRRKMELDTRRLLEAQMTSASTMRL